MFDTLTNKSIMVSVKGRKDLPKRWYYIIYPFRIKGEIIMLAKQCKMYKEWLRATNRKHSLENMAFFIRQYKDTLNNLSRYYK